MKKIWEKKRRKMKKKMKKNEKNRKSTLKKREYTEKTNTTKIYFCLIMQYQLKKSFIYIVQCYSDFFHTNRLILIAFLILNKMS